ncbi:MAG: hypothetical protein R3247_04360 [Rhodothermales bacterium]|nr:hypothetical protein [Rhodothermales bacterium]
MTRRIRSHVALLRRRLRHMLWAAIASGGATLAAAVLLLPTPRAGWFSMVLLAGLVGFLVRKIAQGVHARNGLRQLALEEQFVCHGPPPEGLAVCLRRRQHLWRRSLVLHGLHRYTAAPPPASRFYQERQVHFRRLYRRTLAMLFPPRLPVDALWLAALVGGWLYAVPAAVLTAAAPALLGGAALLLAALAAESVSTVAGARLRTALDGFVTLLADWTLDRRLDAVLRPRSAPAYRHRPVYRAPAVLALSEVA